MSSIGPTELVVFLLIIILFYALGRLPEFGGALGKANGVFKQAAEDTKPGSGIDSHADTIQTTSTSNSKT